MRNSSLVKCFRAENTTGLKHITEFASYKRKLVWVGERCIVERSHTERSDGRDTSENVGISSENIGENPMHRKSKVSRGRLVRAGLGGT